jgi:hypothetical protein
MNGVEANAEPSWTYGGIIVNQVGSATAANWRLNDNYNAGDGIYSLMLFINSTSGDAA